MLKGPAPAIQLLCDTALPPSPLETIDKDWAAYSMSDMDEVLTHLDPQGKFWKEISYSLCPFPSVHPRSC